MHGADAVDPTVHTRSERSDSRRSRERLLDAAGELLAERGLAFTLPDLARRSGVSSATTYRHFSDPFAVFDAYYERTMGGLVSTLVDLVDTADPERSVDRVCREWVERAIQWGRAAVHIRRPTGYLERLRGGDPLINELHRQLAELVDALRAGPEGFDIDTDYAVLLWVTLFDERVIVDLRDSLGWSTTRITRSLAASLRAAWSN